MTNKEDYLERENSRLHLLLEQAGVDAAAGDLANKLQTFLINELNHRIKNLMAMFMAIATSTLRTARDLPSAQEALRSRVIALSRSHDLLLASNMDSAPLHRLIENAIEPFSENGRFTLSIPDLAVSAASTLAIALVINELCTNAVKYGALSTPNGHVDLIGQVNGETFVLIWTESKGPPVFQPLSLSFGASIIKVTLPESEVDLRFFSGGIVCDMRIPLASLK